MKTYEVWDNQDPKTRDYYPYEVVEIDEDGSKALALFHIEKDAYHFKARKEEGDEIDES